MSNKGKKEPIIKFDLRDVLSFTDIYTIIILSIYLFLALINYSKISNSTELILTDLFIIAGIISIASADIKLNSPGKLFRLFRRIYIAPLIFLIYSQAQVYIRVINPVLYDSILIGWDYSIFGFNPTQALQKFNYPPLTEFLQFSYMTYFFLPIIHGVELHLRGKDKEFAEFSRIICFSFFLSYIGYFFLPAIGPRFTLHNFSLISKEMPGLWLTEFFRGIVNSGGGINQPNVNPVLLINRDCMPSGHTWITLVNIILAFKFRSKSKWLIAFFGFSLIFATIYLRYHYFVDVLAGIILAFLTFPLEKMLRKLLSRFDFRQN